MSLLKKYPGQLVDRRIYVKNKLGTVKSRIELFGKPTEYKIEFDDGKTELSSLLSR